MWDGAGDGDQARIRCHAGELPRSFRSGPVEFAGDLKLKCRHVDPAQPGTRIAVPQRSGSGELVVAPHHPIKCGIESGEGLFELFWPRVQTDRSGTRRALAIGERGITPRPPFPYSRSEIHAQGNGCNPGRLR